MNFSKNHKYFGFFPSANCLKFFAANFLKEPHSKRFVERFVDGKTVIEIAKNENISKSSVSRSLTNSVKLFLSYGLNQPKKTDEPPSTST